MHAVRASRFRERARVHVGYSLAALLNNFRVRFALLKTFQSNNIQTTRAHDVHKYITQGKLITS